MIERRSAEKHLANNNNSPESTLPAGGGTARSGSRLLQVEEQGLAIALHGDGMHRRARSVHDGDASEGSTLESSTNISNLGCL